MLVRFKKSGKIKDTKAGNVFVKVGIAEKVEEKKKPDPKLIPKPANKNKKPATKKRGRPKRKK